MSGDHAKKEIVTGGDKSTSHGKAPPGESDNKMKGALHIPSRIGVATRKRR
jgi:hypothetical protein